MFLFANITNTLVKHELCVSNNQNIYSRIFTFKEELVGEINKDGYRDKTLEQLMLVKKEKSKIFLSFKVNYKKNINGYRSRCLEYLLSKKNSWKT